MNFHRSRNSVTRFSVVAVLAAFSLFMAACGSSSSSSSTTVANGSTTTASLSPYIFHADLSETGAGSFLGSRQAKALTDLADYVNSTGGIKGHKIQLDIEDNQSSPATSVSIATPWIAQNVQFIFNGSIAAAAKAVDALAGKTGPVIYDLTPVNPAPPNSYIFASGISFKLDFEAILNMLRSKGLMKIAFLNSTDVSGAVGWPVLQSLLALPANSGFQLVSHQSFDPAAVSITTQMSVIKAANPQALIVWTTGTPIGTVFHAQSQLGMSAIPTFTHGGNAVTGEMQHLQSVLPKEIYFPTGPLYLPPSSLPSNLASVVSTFQSIVAKAGGHPNDGWGLAYAPALMLIAALDHYGVNATSTQIKSYIESLSSFPNIYGVFHMSPDNHTGIDLQGVYMTTWNGTTFVQASGPGGLPKS
ncbi:MAG: ABC transporter substrate-binding protein [Acidimicrobiaceae bacterium]|nr:ABC transporter substrate-binding protein [Acidimicrobiaceae bacterium]